MRPEIIIDLNRPPDERWDVINPYKKQAKTLIKQYLEDINYAGEFDKVLLNQYESFFVSKNYRAEVSAIAKSLRIPRNDVLLGNLYYDALKMVLGCSAFAIDTPTGPLHARNLDWHSDSNILDKFTNVQQYVNGINEYMIIGWPGYIGALSGMAAGKFSISLNAVISDEKPGLAPPITFLIRDVLETAKNYKEAVKRLSSETIFSDCILLVTGIDRSEMVIIERTPTKARIRYPKDGFISATNNYQLIEGMNLINENDLHASTCSRYERMCQLLKKKKVVDESDCFDILNDSQVKMNITMQQMVFRPSSGDYYIG
ncbi:MAG: C45 family autoproteolytic acyltransferase/hydrolase [Bacteroidota bacterium]